ALAHIINFGGIMGLYKYVSFSNLKHLLDGSVRFTQPNAFNDPFELLPEINLTEDINGFSINVLEPARSNEPARLDNAFKSKNCNDVVAREVRNECSNLIGILCLSRNPHSLLMWSHYADEYKGAVIEFDEEHEFFTGLSPVKYEPARPKIDFNLLIDESGYIRLSELYYKPEEWKYEGEVRIARNLQDCKLSGHYKGFDVYTMEVPLECIKSITIGERMPVEEQRVVFGKIYNTNIALKLAAISNWGYGFRDELIKFNCPITEMPPQISPRTAHIFKDLKGELGDIARLLLEKHRMSVMVNKTA
ncbi:DUF2971 domain-containing protein, partial [Vibrio cholerae]|uniref:DUF2971 domain-containing protein n=2 Tax=Vibrionaceae TaxID=641 RepID=UPI0020D08B03